MKLDDALGDFLVRVTCLCGTSRHIEPEARVKAFRPLAESQ
jgi:hypothetical protein